MIKDTQQRLSKCNDSYVIIITGSTASGKTALSLKLGEFFPIEIINADVGQFYESLSIGTAKPRWRDQPIAHHLFDILKKPCDFTVVDYRRMVLKTITEIRKRKRLPVIVGGSLFYIKSLFFSPQEYSIKKTAVQETMVSSNDSPRLWQCLNKIDPARAAALHPNDTYRIRRALDIWEETGMLPSQCAPKFAPPFHSRLVFIDLPSSILKKNIAKRTTQMFAEGWIEEVRQLIGTPWEKYIQQKRFIGYKEIITWIKEGGQPNRFDDLFMSIVKNTCAYANKQRVFWKSFEHTLTKNKECSPFFCSIMMPVNTENQEALAIKSAIEDDLTRYVHRS